ncbi:MAG: hypothetical protein WA108_02625 [Thiobacillus sp.]
MKKALFLALCFSCFHSTAWAEYVATGPIEGNVCKGFGIEWCSYREIAAVRGDGDRLYEVKTTYDSVTEYDKTKKRCWIKTKSKDGGLISWGVNALKQPVFLEKTSSGKLEELDVEYITFPCLKRQSNQ